MANGIPIGGGIGGGYNIGGANFLQGAGGQNPLAQLMQQAQQDPNGPIAKLMELLQGMLAAQQKQGPQASQGGGQQGGAAPAGGAAPSGGAQQAAPSEQPSAPQMEQVLETFQRLDPATQKLVLEAFPKLKEALQKSPAFQQALAKAGGPATGGVPAVGKT